MCLSYDYVKYTINMLLYPVSLFYNCHTFLAIDLETSGDFASGDFHEWTDDEDDEDEIMNDEDEIEDDDEDEGDDDDDDDDHDGYIW